MGQILITDFMGDDPSLERGLMTDAGFAVHVASHPDPRDWIQHAETADAILTRHAPIEADTIERLERCRVIARYGTGHDNVDVAAASERGIAVTNVPAYCTEEVADHTMALLLTTARFVPSQADVVRSGGWTPTPLPPVRRLSGRRLALFGCGRVGAAVTRRAAAFGLSISAYDPHASELPEGVVRAESLNELMVGADILSLHTPLTPSTRRAVGRTELETLNRGAIVINVARGGLLDLEAAIDLLEAGHLSGLGLDVVDDEPPALDHRVRHTPGVVLTPHVGYYSVESVDEARRRSTAEILAVLRGHDPLHPVNDVRGRE